MSGKFIKNLDLNGGDFFGVSYEKGGGYQYLDVTMTGTDCDGHTDSVDVRCTVFDLLRLRNFLDSVISETLE